ncbi:MAG TPA: HD domain-containing phosphohydrolase [Anaerolineales bacterium]|nr:HD domain-containing phosphohydrolase [Anaerolineales bacterium]
MTSSLTHRSPLFIAGVISLTAQGLLLAPTQAGTFLSFLPIWGIRTLGFILFILSIFLFTVTIRSLATFNLWGGWRIYGFILATQLVTPAGIYLLMGGSTALEELAGFLMGGTITILTTISLILLSVPGSRIIPDSFNRLDRGIIQPDSNSDANPDGLNEQIASLTMRLDAEKRRSVQLTFLNELSQQLEAELEPEVAAQLAVNTLERAIECSFVSLMYHEPEHQQFSVLAAAGNSSNTLPVGYKQDSEKGILGRTLRLKKTQIVNDARLDPDFLPLNNKNTLSVVSVPVLQNGQIKSILEICSDSLNAFSSVDAAIAESVAAELMRAWERSGYHQRLRELIQAGISLTTLLDPQAAVQEIARIARKTLEARFVFVTLLDQQGNFSRIASTGEAPRLLASLGANPTNEPIMQAALNATKPFRVRDLRKYASPNKLDIDNASLRSALAIPIRLHRLSIGTILAFGKREGVFFTENDESLADLLSSQAAASIESSWLYQELRNTLNTTSMLYQLSVDVIQAEELSKAAELISQAAHKVTNAKETGIVLLTRDGKVEAEVELDSNGFHTRREHPTATIEQAIQSSQSIIVSTENGSLVCYPLLTRGGTYGALWMNIPESRGQNFANLQTLANQAAITLERSILLSESQRQAKQLEAAYLELELTYDRTLTSLMSALDARDRETEGHSVRVSLLACMLAEELGISRPEIKALERGALLHDIGKIGISDTILHKPGKLTEEEWAIMRIHPKIGARIVEGIPFLKVTLPVIRFHHERWDGSGYPDGLKGKEIPIQARIFAVADVFDALTSKRSYRMKSSPREAILYMQENSGVLFDPEIVDALVKLPYHELIEGEKPLP